MKDLEIVREKVQNRYRVIKNDEDLEWNRAIDLCTNIINAHLSRGNTPEFTRSSRDNEGWIPVDERLPEDETMMLVTCQTKAGRRSVNRAWYGTECWHGTGSMSGVIAWMPLPEPYSPERSSNEEE